MGKQDQDFLTRAKMAYRAQLQWHQLGHHGVAVSLPPLQVWPQLPDEALRNLVHTLFVRHNLKPEDVKKLATELENFLGRKKYSSLMWRMHEHMVELGKEKDEKLLKRRKIQTFNEMGGFDYDDVDCINWATRPLFFIGDYC